MAKTKPSPDGRESRSIATQSRIISVARKEFANHGYAGASLSTIVEKSGVTTGAIYHHYKDKKGLFRAVAIDLEEEIMAHVSSLPAQSDPWEGFTTVLAAAIEICARPDIARIVFKEAPSVIGPEEWRAIEVEYSYGMVRDTIGELAKAGLMHAPAPDMVAQILLGAVIEAAHAVASSTDKAKAVADAQAAILTMVSALRVTPKET